jgi:hypothetical protein
MRFPRDSEALEGSEDREQDPLNPKFDLYKMGDIRISYFPSPCGIPPGSVESFRVRLWK